MARRASASASRPAADCLACGGHGCGLCRTAATGPTGTAAAAVTRLLLDRCYGAVGQRAAAAGQEELPQGTDEEHAAAAKIQFALRGRTRTRLQAEEVPEVAPSFLQKEELPQGTDEEHAAAARIQAVHRGKQARAGVHVQGVAPGDTARTPPGAAAGASQRQEAPAPGRAERDAAELEGLDPFARDAVRLLRGYPDLRAAAEPAREAEDVPEVALAFLQKASPKQPSAPTHGASAKAQAQVQQATHRFTQALREQHEGWVSAREELARSSLQMRHREVDAVRREYADPELGKWLREHAEEHLSRLRRSDKEGALREAASEEDEGRIGEICNKVLPRLRQEWRAGQRALLQQIAKELHTEREAARKALEAQVLHSEKVAEAARECWAGELRAAGQELERLEQRFRAGLEAAYSSELRAVQQHATDQAAFFQRETREALQALQDQQAGPASQLRRATLAMLKWRQDYIRDARNRARVAVQTRRAAARVEAALAELQARGANLSYAPGDRVAVVLRDRSWRAAVVTETNYDGSVCVAWDAARGTPRSSASGSTQATIDDSEDMRMIIEDGAERVEFYNVFPGERAGKKVTFRVRSEAGPSGFQHPKREEGLEVVVLDHQGVTSLVGPLRRADYDPETRDLTLQLFRRHGSVQARIPAGEEALVVPRLKWMASLVGVEVEGAAKGYPELHGDMQRVETSREILGEVWERLPVAEEERRAFLLRLARRIPPSGEVLRLFEEHLAEHGVLSALPGRGGEPRGGA